MSLLPRGTRAAARPLRLQSCSTISSKASSPIASSVIARAPHQSTRRNASSSHDNHGGDHGAGESAHHAEVGGTGNESFGKGFYITLGAIPLFYLGYTLASSEDNVVQRYYLKYQQGLAQKEARDVLHTKALEQAIADKAILYGNRADHSRDLRYTEFFNHGSPWNVVAGEGTADLSKLAQHYDEQRKRLESERLDRMNAKQ